jgi:phage terminase small subunit
VVMILVKLTDNQEKFVQELIAGNSQRVAYRIAYPKSVNWKDSAVDSNASTLFANAKVLQRYNEIHDRLIKEAEDECIVSAKEVLRELKRIGFADIKDFISFRTGKVFIGFDAHGNPVSDYQQIIQMKDSDDVDGKMISEVSINAKGVFSFKLHDKMSALDKLGKHLKLFTDKLEINDVTPVVIDDDISEE